MKIVIEFYRIRKSDGAYATVGRETAEAANLDAAVEIARQLAQTLSMPLHPDAVAVRDGDGNMLCSGMLAPTEPPRQAAAGTATGNRASLARPSPAPVAAGRSKPGSQRPTLLVLGAAESLKPPS
ncbi:hypothetical protein BN1110_06251 [bacterium YEK0313]|nr:hypothetical protein BN1110_06251 [bacterium YEK0313]